MLKTEEVICWGGGNFGGLGYGNEDTIGDNEIPSSAGFVNINLTVCGDGAVELGEQCDDGDTTSGDGCSSLCVREVGFICAGSPSNCTTTCGDGVTAGAETCDDGDAQSGDGCSNNCLVENGFECVGQPSDCDLIPVVVQVAAGFEHACALSNTGNVRCWGRNDVGQLGYGNTTTIGDNETPSSAGNVNVGGFVTQIVTGNFHTCALLDTGNVRCWGSASFGQLGYGNTNNIGDNETPASAGNVFASNTPVIQLAAGGAHTCALSNDGTIRCWGDNQFGQLGRGNTADVGDNEAPVSGVFTGLIGMGEPVIQITTGQFFSCALLASGAVRCWGVSGRLGLGELGSVGDDEFPIEVPAITLGGAAVQISSGFDHTCALFSAGNIRCWGSGDGGSLGYANENNIGDDETPASAGDVNVGGSVASLALGGHSCAVLDDGDARCWGPSGVGQLGYGNENFIGDDETPASAGDVPVGGQVVQMSVGFAFSCALLTDGNVRCWGSNNFGQLGYGNTTNIGDDEIPANAGNVSVF
jgi:cysteine-rich repeat protein